MGGLGGFLFAFVGPLAKKILASLGIGLVSFIGVQAAVGALLEQARAAWSGMGSEVASYLGLAGAHTALSVIAGAIVARVALMTLKKLAVL